MGRSIFETLLNLVTARELQSPLGPTLEHDQSVDEACSIVSAHRLRDWPLEVSLIVKDGKTAGWADYALLLDAWDEEMSKYTDDFDDEDEEPNVWIPPGAKRVLVREVMESVQPHLVVSANTPAFSVAEILASEKEFLFVIEGNAITGTLIYEDLFKPAFRVCLFALMIELEEAALNLICIDALMSWKVLSPDRRQYALDRFNTKRARYPTQFADFLSRGHLDDSWHEHSRRIERRIESETNAARRSVRGKQGRPVRDEDVNGDYRARSVLRETMFADKGSILMKRNLVPIMPKIGLRELIKKAEKLRNACVHAGQLDADLVDQKGFWPLLKDLQRLLEFIESKIPSILIPREREGRLWLEDGL